MVDPRRFQERLWADGDYAQIAPRLQGVGDAVASAANLRGARQVLDLGAAVGDTAIAAAREGVQVTAADLSTTWFDAGRQNARTAGVDIEWLEADPLHLPFADRRFDRVLAANAGMLLFAPAEQAARAVVRVGAADARIVLANWTAEGTAGRVSMLLAPYLPAAPPGAAPGRRSGEQALAVLFKPLGVTVTAERRGLRFEAASVDEFVTFTERVHGPVILAKRAAEQKGEWAEVRAAIAAIYAGRNLAGDGSLRFDQEYLLAVGTRG